MKPADSSLGSNEDFFKSTPFSTSSITPEVSEELRTSFILHEANFVHQWIVFKLVGTSLFWYFMFALFIIPGMEECEIQLSHVGLRKGGGAVHNSLSG